MYQTTIKVEGFVTLTTNKKLKKKDLKNIIISLDVDTFFLDKEEDVEINETEVIKTDTTVVKV